MSVWNIILVGKYLNKITSNPFIIKAQLEFQEMFEFFFVEISYQNSKHIFSLNYLSYIKFDVYEFSTKRKH